MTYEEYINALELLKVSNDLIIKDKVLNSNLDSSLLTMIEPKIIDLIKTKYQRIVDKLISNLDFIFSDNYNLDQYMVNFKKEVVFIYDLTNIKELSDEKKNEMKNMIKNETKKVYDILINKANQIDISGVLMMNIKNNEIKWGE